MRGSFAEAPAEAMHFFNDLETPRGVGSAEASRKVPQKDPRRFFAEG